MQKFKTISKYSLSTVATCYLLWYVLGFAKIYTFIASDFTQDFLAAKALFRGQAIYGASIGDLCFEFFGNRAHDNFHPPFVALLVYPYAFLTYQEATSMHIGLTFFSYFLIIWISAWHFNKLNHLYYILPLSLIWYPFIEHLGLLQISIFLSLAILM